MSNVLTGPISGQLLQSGWVLCLVGVREGENSGPIDLGDLRPKDAHGSDIGHTIRPVACAAFQSCRS